jgi:UDP-N-acetylglucosamine--N-acetylmuramyl-(pentapeptide) pyrophosphoryl-undecaprenol N-acetylglucosamine transferase
MPKALFLPSYLGGGYGHISRCLALSEGMEQRAWTTAFALGGYHVKRVEDAGYRVYDLRRPFQPRPLSGDGPAYMVFSDLNYQVVRDGYHTPATVRGALSEQLRVVRDFQPDLLVSDSWLLGGILAYLEGIPVVQIVRSATHPAAPCLIWWQEQPEGLVSPDPKPVFNPILKKIGLPGIERSEDLLWADLYLAPSLPELDPLPQGQPDTYYIGPLSRRRPAASETPSWLTELDPHRPVVYLTLGGGADPVGGSDIFRIFFDALGETDLQVIASTGARLSPGDLPEPPTNFRLEAWTPGPEAIAASDLVIYPGGYGTTMELIRAGVPGLVIPFHTEQESNGRRLEEAGAGRVLLPVEGEPRQVWKDWQAGRFSLLVYSETGLKAPKLKELTLAMLADDRYRQNARRLQSLASDFSGPQRAVDLMEGLLASRSTPVTPGWKRLSWWQKVSLR